MNNRYFVVTTLGYLMTNDELIAKEGLTIDKIIEDPSVLDDPGSKKKHWIAAVTKNEKPYWDSEKGYV